MGDELTPVIFGEALGSGFDVLPAPGEAGIELVLHDVVAHSPSPDAPRAQPFSLIFLGPAGQHHGEPLRVTH